MEFLSAGIKRFPDSDKMKKILARVKEAAAKDPEAASALESMGYPGNADDE